MFRNAALILLGAIIANVPQADAAVTDETPYYMCFAYTEDGMLFAGGDFNLERGRKMLATNCDMPKSLTVVLLKTIMVRKNGKIRSYEMHE
jgi:hypothetical protein